MTRDEYKKYLRMLGEELQRQGVTGEILVADDVVVILDVKNPEDSDDINAYFNGHGVIVREIAAHVAAREHLPSSWLEELPKCFLYSQLLSNGWNTRVYAYIKRRLTSSSQ